MGALLEFLNNLPIAAINRIQIQELKSKVEKFEAQDGLKDKKISEQERIIQELQEAAKVVCSFPKCPNCSTPVRPFFMRPMSPDEKEITHQDHVCSKCNFSL